MSVTQRYKEQVIRGLKDQTQEDRGILLDIAESRAFIYPLQASALGLA